MEAAAVAEVAAILRKPTGSRSTTIGHSGPGMASPVEVVAVTAVAEDAAGKLPDKLPMRH